MDEVGQREFGRRRRANPSNGGRGSRAQGKSAAANWFAAEPADTAGPQGVVPTKLWPILQAAIAMLIVQLLLLFLMSGPSMRAPHAPAVGSNAFLSFFLPALLAQCWNSAHFAAIYTMLAHATLRWIGWSSPKAYALGGLAAAYVLMALNALQGAHLTWAEAAIELGGGFVAGYMYRLAAGKAPKQQA